MLLKQRRIECGLTQKQIAEIMGVGRTAVAMWEAGVSNPPAVKLPDLARALRCTVDELFEEKGA